MIPLSERDNYALFLDCLSRPIIARLSQPASSARPTPRAKRKARGGSGAGKTPVTRPQQPGSEVWQAEENGQEEESGNAEDLAEFIDYVATELFLSLPAPLRSLTYHVYASTPALQEQYPTPPTLYSTTRLWRTVPATVSDTLSTYALLPNDPSSSSSSSSSLPTFLHPVLVDYMTTLTTPPPHPISTRASACEICGRDWIPLTYHHLIPKAVHAKAVKRGWHPEWRLESVAWLCRACHSFVHGIASNEELARTWWSVELLVGREDVKRWAAWAGRVRWKAR
ncbi:MAG: hypothetical protein M1833_005063 [Piccolia ochrophora]|nr:MAG: hypothetical protein M1833_005063 [Piccolia ochrophora]